MLVSLLCILVLVLSALVIGLLQSHAAIVRALDDLGVDLSRDAKGASGRSHSRERIRDPALTGAAGSEALGMNARDLIGTDFEGNPMAVAVTHVPRTTLVAFLSSGCLTCHGFWEGLSDPEKRAAASNGAAVVAVTKGTDAESPAATAKLAGRDLLTIMSSEAWEDYSVPVAPYFVLVDGRTDRVIGEGSAATFEQLGDLMQRAEADRSYTRGLRVERVSRRDLPGALLSSMSAGPLPIPDEPEPSDEVSS